MVLSPGLRVPYFVALAETRYLKDVRCAPACLKVSEAAAPDPIPLVLSFICGLARNTLNATTREVKFLAAFSEPASRVRHVLLPS